MATCRHGAVTLRARLPAGWPGARKLPMKVPRKVAPLTLPIVDSSGVLGYDNIPISVSKNNIQGKKECMVNLH